MEKYILENQESFKLEDIFDCGQCFRWNKQEDGSYIGVIKDAVIKVEQKNNKIIFSGESDRDFKSIINYYFDLETNYSDYKNKLSKVDEFLSESIKFGEGIRILKQDLWECIISFIISANNNIPRIKKIIERLSEKYGEKIVFDDKEYYKFPTPEALGKASVQDLRDLGVGFRDKRIYNTTKMVLEKQVDLEKIEKLENDLKALDKETVLKAAKNQAKKIEVDCKKLARYVKDKSEPILEEAVDSLREKAIDVTKHAIEKLENK